MVISIIMVVLQGLLGEVQIKQVLRSPIYPQSETEQALLKEAHRERNSYI